MKRATTLDEINAASQAEFVAALADIYEHSPWVAERAAAQRPFLTLAQLKRALVVAVREAGEPAQLALLRAHPALAERAGVTPLTAASQDEQARAGLAHCTSEEFASLQSLNARYLQRFGWPFILAVRGPRASGLSRREILDTFARRLDQPQELEFAECLRQVHRIAEIRLDERLRFEPVLGRQVWDWAQALAAHSDAAPGTLTVTYLTGAHRACARQLAHWMRECGFDEVGEDALGNVVGLYRGSAPAARRLLTGSHYDTVRNGGRFDGRLGILVPMACVRALHASGRRLPFDLELIGFAEEEGQRYKATFLASSALGGTFDARWLDQRDAQGVSMREAMQAAGLREEDIPAIRRDPARYLGFVEIHIEQGPVLDELDLPLGAVSSINGSVRYLCEVVGVASHAGTTPMDRRRDAAVAAAEIALYVEERAKADRGSVGTLGMLQVPDGSINVVPGRCRFSLDLRAPDDAQRDALARDVLQRIGAICADRGVRCSVEETLRAAAAPSDAGWQRRWEEAIARLGLPVHRMPSGAGHDAMKLHELMPQAMLFVRGGNAGISHNPLETVTDDDAHLSALAFLELLEGLAGECAAPTRT